jgi:hypothetical protein
LITSIIVFVSCNYKTVNQTSNSDTLKKLIRTDTINTKLPSVKKNDLREFGERINTIRDFDGDGKVAIQQQSKKGKKYLNKMLLTFSPQTNNLRLDKSPIKVCR